MEQLTSSNMKKSEDILVDWEKSKVDDLPILKVNGYRLQSRYNPIKEAENTVSEFFKKHHLHILFGLGNLYLYMEIIKKLSENEFLIIYEPSKILFDEIENSKILKDLLNHEQVITVIDDGKQDLSTILFKHMVKFDKRIIVEISPNYKNIFPTQCKAFLECVKETALKKHVEKNTQFSFATEWQKNLILNIKNGFEATSLNVLKQKLTCPVIVVSGGPSLIKQLPFLKENANKCFIICAGSTINTLLKNDITPDLIITIDGGEPNYQHFKDLNISHIPIVYSMHVHTKIPSMHKGKKLLIHNVTSSNHHMMLEKLLEHKIVEFYGGGSVANFALEVANFITSGPICLIGQDLAYTNMQSHASGNTFHKVISEEDIKMRKMFYVEGYYGDQVLTDIVFSSMRDDFMTLVNLLNLEDRLFNCTEGGINIKGIKKIPFNEFIQTYCGNEIMEEKMLVHKVYISRNQNDWNGLKKRVSLIKSILKKAKNNCNKALRILEESSIITYKNNRKLNELDKLLMKSLKNDFLSYIVQPIIHDVKHNFLEKDEETEIEKNNRIHSQSLTLYKGILESIDSVIPYLEESIIEIQSELEKGSTEK